MLVSSDSRWLQWAFATLVGLIDRVGLKTNVGNMVSMTCRPCRWARSVGHADRLPHIVFSPTRSNNPTRVAKAHCSQRGSDDATRPSSAWKRVAWCLPSRPCHHRGFAAVRPQQPSYPLSHPISLQDFQAPGPVQGVIRLGQFQEDHVQYFLPHGCKL